jgi:hypothetical protein
VGVVRADGGDGVSSGGGRGRGVREGVLASMVVVVTRNDA